jgi:hypothetical protein
MAEYVNDEDFDRVQETNRHKQLVNALKGIAVSIQEKQQSDLKTILDHSAEQIEKLFEQMPKPDNEQIVLLGKEIKDGLAEIEQALLKPKTQTFKVNRNKLGLIDSITVTK